ncbi:hypothetical protein [Pseudescherichia sp.]|uniref:hypothetical protein n=1 Tax=Pseudescherichia sp. TaxID=2055881 RepID=UPI002899A345|nr:hypothetical protein [Pseudescherichia sp.]
MNIISKKTNGIAAAFGSRKETVYVVNRHGRRRRFLSRSSALNNLAHIMVQFVFDKQGKPTHAGGYERQREDGVIECNRGELTEQYWNAHHRTHRRMMKLLAHQRAVEKWNQRWDAWVSQREELLKQKPF